MASAYERLLREVQDLLDEMASAWQALDVARAELARLPAGSPAGEALRADVRREQARLDGATLHLAMLLDVAADGGTALDALMGVSLLNLRMPAYLAGKGF